MNILKKLLIFYLKNILKKQYYTITKNGSIKTYVFTL